MTKLARLFVPLTCARMARLFIGFSLLLTVFFCAIVFMFPTTFEVLTSPIMVSVCASLLLCWALLLMLKKKWHTQTGDLRKALDVQAQRLGRLLGAVDEAWWEWDVALGVVHFSARWWDLLGYPQGEPTSDARLWLRLVHPDDIGRVNQMLIPSHEPQVKTTIIEMQVRHKDGFYIPLMTRYLVAYDNTGTVTYVSGISVDLRERNRTEVELQQAVVVLATTREGIMITDVNGIITQVNQAFSEISGYSAAEAVGRKSTLLQSGRHNEDFYSKMWQQLNRDGCWRGEIWNRRKSGDIYPELLSISAVRNRADRICNYVGVFADISKAKASEMELNFLAHHDPLTQLPNRLLFLSLLDHNIKKAHREKGGLILLMVDLDRFKDINDSYGHSVGDELLQQIAATLALHATGSDIVARMGGDEFALLIESARQPERAAGVANEIIAMLDRPWVLSGGAQAHIGVSIGISLFPDHGTNSSELLQHADAALSIAKNEGRGCFRYFSENLTQAARERINLESRLHRAIERDELRVYYQPQVDIISGRITGAEALVRWQDVQEGLVPPARFIPIAEASSLIHDIGAWVMRQTCLQGQRWIEQGFTGLTLAVNLSAKQFLYGDMEVMVEDALRASGFPAAQLELELTESALMERKEDVLSTLNRLRALGVRLSIDDFGTGYSSLSYLTRFPLDVLKIDKSFVDALPDNPGDKAIAEAIVAMGHALGFKVLAEGVENEQQRIFLQDLGCDSYQGYLFSRPVTAEIFTACLQRQQQAALSVTGLPSAVLI